MKRGRFSTIREIVFLTISIAFILASVFSFYIPKTQGYSGKDYDYELLYQSPYPSVLSPDETTNVYIEIKNTGSETWYNSGSNIVRLGSGSSYGNYYQNRDYDSEFANTDWLSPNRPVTISESSITTGSTTQFQFNIKAPSAHGTYKAYFTPVVDGLKWMRDMGIYWEITVIENGNQEVYENPSTNQVQIDNDYETSNYNNSLSSDNSGDQIDTRDILEDYAPSVVKIFCKKNPNSNTLSKGSGTLLKNTTNNPDLPNYYIITNLHVIETGNSYIPRCLIQIYPDYKNSKGYLLFKSTNYKYYDENIDIAIIEPQIVDYNDQEHKKIADFVDLNFANSYFGDYNTLGSNSMNDSGIMNNRTGNDDILFLLGFPGFGGANLTITTGVVLGFRNYNGINYIETNAKVGPGFSGGLAIDEDGDIIGIPSILITRKSENLSLVLYLHDLPNLALK